MKKKTLCIYKISITLLLIFFLPKTASSQGHIEMVEMRDGIHLATTIYLPSGDGPFPTLLYRTPYDDGPQFAGIAPTYYEAGIAVVTQDMRGRFESEGTYMVFTQDGDGELKDGFDTMQWIVNQNWSNGLIATEGNSAAGIVQYMQASANPPGLVLIAPMMGTPNLYSDGIFWDGVRRYWLSHTWLEGNDVLYFEDEFANHPFEDEFWASVQTRDQFNNVHTAGYHIGGWFDIFQNGNIEGYIGYQHKGGVGAVDRQKLIIGPWTHGGYQSLTQGEMTFPDNSLEPPYPIEDVWYSMLNHYLQVNHPDIHLTPDDIPNVQYYVMGDVDEPDAPGNVWRTADDWPPEAVKVHLYLQPNGGLNEEYPPNDGGITSYVFNPDDPSPTIGGTNMNISPGSRDQREIEARNDVVVFETNVLTVPMEITGRVFAHLFVDIDQPDADLMVRMTDVYPDGRSMLIADGAFRLATRGSTIELTPLELGEIVEGVVDLWSTSLIVNVGHRLRISVTSSNWPRFSVNHNNGLSYPESVEGDSTPVTVNIHHNKEYASYLEVPDPTREVLDIKNSGESILNGFGITSIYPNPFNNSTKISFNLFQDSSVKMNLYTITGKLVTKLLNTFLHKGKHSVNYDAKGLGSGVYIVQLSTVEGFVSSKLILLK